VSIVVSKIIYQALFFEKEMSGEKQ